MTRHNQSDARARLTQARRVVVKIGSSLLTDHGQGLNRAAIDGWVDQIAGLSKRGVQVLLVTSGAVAEGMSRLGVRARPHALHELQAMAAIGQMGLVQVYETSFQRHGRHTAQVLLTHEDLADRSRYLNARSTLRSIIDFGVVPVINENDTVATEEIRLGDNDTLAALVANLVEADVLLILTDQEGLYDRDPRAHSDAVLVTEGEAGDEKLLAMAGGAGTFGRGGMLTKLTAAAKAARSGAETVIAPGRHEGVITRVLSGEAIGTHLSPAEGRVAARKQWLAGQLRIAGRLTLDAGAVRVLRDSGKSLLAVGVKRIEGQFERGDLVSCLDPEGREVARGLVNYNAADAARILGKPTDQIEAILGYVDELELIHRDNLVLL